MKTYGCFSVYTTCLTIFVDTFIIMLISRVSILCFSCSVLDAMRITHVKVLVLL